VPQDESCGYVDQAVLDSGRIARYYDPALARFLTPDTVNADPGDPQQLNRYSYVRNNPVRSNDPSGHCLGWLWGAPDCRLARSVNELDVEGALDNVQTGLDVAGMIPVAGEALDLVNAGISAARGDTVGAALSLAAMAPIGGQAASVGKLTVKYGDEAAAVLAHADAVVPALSRSGDEAAAAMCSFSADTPVITAAGAVAIGAVVTGTHVLAWDEASGATGSYTVTAVLVHPDPVLLHLTLDGETLVTTPEHPFFTQARGWVAAGDLRVGERVRQLDGDVGVVQDVALEQRPQVMYNLTVAHTFFVGEEGWLVHNTCGDLVDPKTLRFTQNSISRAFQDGRTVDDLIDGLASGRVTADDVPPLRVFEQNGSTFSLDNRRLYAFQEAGVPVRTVPATPKQVRDQAYKFRTKNGGTSIRVRGGVQE
jgi:RHS repeat-associated protein